MNLHKVEFIRSAAKPSDFIQDGLPQIAFAGKSNVGKSSVINRLLQRKNFARVGEAPGKTVHVNYFLVDGRVYLVDLPGYGYAKTGREERRRWDALINGYFEARRPLVLLVQLLDSRHAPSADDVQMMEYLQYHGIPFLAALTKADKLKAAQKQQAVQHFQTLCLPYGARDVVLTSAQDGFGMDALRGQISLACEAAQQ